MPTKKKSKIPYLDENGWVVLYGEEGYPVENEVIFTLNLTMDIEEGSDLFADLRLKIRDMHSFIFFLSILNGKDTWKYYVDYNDNDYLIQVEIPKTNPIFSNLKF